MDKNMHATATENQTKKTKNKSKLGLYTDESWKPLYCCGLCSVM